MIRILSILLALLLSSAAWSQKISVSGKVIDNETGETCIAASVALLNAKDSTLVTGASTRTDGTFVINTSKAGNYILRTSYVGFVTQAKNITLEKKQTLDVGTIRLASDTKLLNEAVVSTNVAQVEMKADTFVYNAAAYRVPPGSNLEELVKKMPGADIDDDGKIKINGKEVKKILVKGKEFFSSDTKQAMKNIPVDMVDKVKAYDKQSDYSRITGIDDGEEETVLDLTIKRGMDKGWMIRANGGLGSRFGDQTKGMEGISDDQSKLLYSANASVQHYRDHTQVQAIANFNNNNSQDSPGGSGGRFRGGSGGLNTVQNVGVNFAHENGKQKDEAGYMEFGGNVFFVNNDATSINKSNSQMFLTGAKDQYTNSFSRSNPGNWNLNANLRFEWKIDSLTTLNFSPGFSYGNNSGNSFSQNATFNEDPFHIADGTTRWSDPLGTLADMDEDQKKATGIVVNTQERFSESMGKNLNSNARFQINRRFMKKGRNLSFDLDGGYSKSDNDSWAKNFIHYYNGSKKNTDQNRYNTSYNPSWNLQGRLSYSEPLGRGWIAQANYSLQYRNNSNDRNQYTRDELLKRYQQEMGDELGYDTYRRIMEAWAMGVTPLFDDVLEGWERDSINSQSASYREFNHNVRFMVRYTTKDINLNFGVSFQPQSTDMDYKKSNVDTIVHRTVFNVAPQVMVRWKRTKTSSISFRYNGRSSQPSMTNLIDVYDTSDPLNISRGNPGLKPSFTHTADLRYNDYITDRQMGWNLGVNYNNRTNTISNATIYDTHTGARYTRPMNINGNWSIGGNANFNTAIGSKKAFNFTNDLGINYNYNVGYMSTNVTESLAGLTMDQIFDRPLEERTSRNLTLTERIRLSYRNDWIEVGPQASAYYNHARNDKQQQGNMDTWQFAYGGNLQLNLPWNLVFVTDITNQCRRGYDDAKMNTNELIWNMQLSKSMLKNRALTLSLQAYDVLQQRSTISRVLTAVSRSDSWSNALTSFFMFRVSYQLNLLGKHQDKVDKRDKMIREALSEGGPGPRGEGAPRGGERGGRGGFGRSGGFGGGNRF